MGKIVWLASYPKSGNTWLRAFLHNYIMEPSSPVSVNGLTDFSAVESAAPFFAPHLNGPVAALSTEAVQKARPQVHADLTRLHEDLVFIKTHNAALRLHDVELCSSQHSAGAVYLVRDPRDVAVSYARYTGRGLDETIDFMSHSGAATRSTEIQVFELLSSWSAHVESWISRPGTLLVRYEDLLQASEEAFGRVIHFLGDDKNTPRLQRAIAFSRFDELSAQERQSGYQAKGPNNAAAFFSNGKAGTWREALSPAQARKLEATHGAMMQRLGYRL